MVYFLGISLLVAVAYAFYLNGLLQDAQDDVEVAAIALEYYKETDDSFMAWGALRVIQGSRSYRAEDYNNDYDE